MILTNDQRLQRKLYHDVILFILVYGVAYSFPLCLSLDSCLAFTTTKTYYEQRMYGEQLSIRLPSGAEKLQFTYMDEIEQEILWSRSTKAKRGVVTGRNDDRKFVIASVTFNDEGTYTVLNFWNRKSSICFLKVVSK